MKKWCFLDLETTGLDAQKDSIIEVSFLVVDEKKKEIARFDSVIKPEKSVLTPFITNLTGITQKEIDETGKTWSDVKNEILEKIGDTVIVGHNIDFDIGFLEANGIPVKKNQRLDTHELARILLVGEASYSLETLAHKYGFEHRDAHRAMSDVEADMELFFFLEKKIQELSPQFLEEIRPILENKTDWYARSLFLETKGNTKKDVPAQFSFPEKSPEAKQLSDDFLKKWEQVTPDNSLYIREKSSIEAAQFQEQVAQKLPERTLIISPKIDFFSTQIKKFPTPEVLLDPEKLSKFPERSEKLTDQETTFFLQCALRHFLGFRGLDAFDLFSQYMRFWDDVKITEDGHPVFQKILAERAEEKTMLISPSAFFRFRNLEIFKGRTLIIDETEVFAEKLLFAASRSFSLAPLLASTNAKVSTGTQFFIARFCQEVIESTLEHKLTPFPEKVLLNKNERFDDFANNLQEIKTGLSFGNGEAANNLQKKQEDILENISSTLSVPREELARWVTYFPESGQLTFGVWDSQAWKEMKQDLGKFKKMYFFRQAQKSLPSFLRVFGGSVQGQFYDVPEFSPVPKCEIPEGLISVKSPDFVAFCAEKIKEISAPLVTEDHFVVANFSSLESLKKIFETLNTWSEETGVSLLGEQTSGGNAKLLQILKQKKKVLLLTQKILDPALAKFPFKTVVVQKFPFSAPHPLFTEIENKLKISGASFWDLWQVPQVSASLSRQISIFPRAQKIILLDARENANWGKEILQAVFA